MEIKKRKEVAKWEILWWDLMYALHIYQIKWWIQDMFIWKSIKKILDK